MKKKICIVTCSFPHFEGDNRAFYMNRYVEMLSDRYEVAVVAPRVFRKSLRYEETAGCKVYRFPSFLSDKLLVEYKRLPVFRLALYMISGLLKTIAVVRKEKCDLVNAHFVLPTGLMGLLAGRLLRKPVLMTIYGTDLTLYRIPVLNSLIRMILNGADAGFAISNYARDVASRFNPKKEAEVIFLCGVDTDKFRPDLDGGKIREEIGIDRDDFLILTVANLTQRRKRIDILLRALAGTREKVIKLLVVGQGPLKPGLEALALELKISERVRYIDFVADEKLPNVYATADLFVLPSEEEGLGIPVMEAMACGLPVIASRATGLLSLVRDGEDGVFFEMNNDQDLAGKIERLYGDAGLRNSLGHNARLSAEKYFSRDVQKQKITGQIDALFSGE